MIPSTYHAYINIIHFFLLNIKQIVIKSLFSIFIVDYDKQALFKFDVLIPLKYRSLVDASMKSKGISVHPVTQEFMKVHHASTTLRDKGKVGLIFK